MKTEHPRRALVTGGTGSVGAAICRRLAALGFHVLVHGHRHCAQATALAATLTQEFGHAEATCFDITDASEAGRVVAALAGAAPIQVLIHAAGIYLDVPMAGMAQEQWRAVMDVSLNGFFNVTQPLLLPMIRARWGRIVGVSSVSALRGNRGQTNYAAAKAGLHGAARSLALEVAPRGITVNVVAPGLIATPATDRLFSQAQIDDLVPMKRAGTPDEVAALVGFLVSDEAAYISGQVISINGGMA